MIIDAFDNIEYAGIPVADIIRDYRAYIDRVKSRYHLVQYTIIGDPTTEYLAHRLYGDSGLFWLLIYLNDIYDPWHGWVKSPEMNRQVSEQRYKNMGGTSQVLYHMDNKFEKFYDLVEYPKGSEVWYHKGDKNYRHVQYVGHLHPITVYDEEEMMDNNKRVIRIVRPEDITNFISDLSRELDRVSRGEA